MARNVFLGTLIFSVVLFFSNSEFYLGLICTDHFEIHSVLLSWTLIIIIIQAAFLKMRINWDEQQLSNFNKIPLLKMLNFVPTNLLIAKIIGINYNFQTFGCQETLTTYLLYHLVTIYLSIFVWTFLSFFKKVHVFWEGHKILDQSSSYFWSY